MDEAWRLLARLVRNRPGEGEQVETTPRQRQHAEAYLVASPESDAAIRLRTMICEGSKEHLQEELAFFFHRAPFARN